MESKFFIWTIVRYTVSLYIKKECLSVDGITYERGIKKQYRKFSFLFLNTTKNKDLRSTYLFPLCKFTKTNKTTFVSLPPTRAPPWTRVHHQS